MNPALRVKIIVYARNTTKPAAYSALQQQLILQQGTVESEVVRTPEKLLAAWTTPSSVILILALAGKDDLAEHLKLLDQAKPRFDAGTLRVILLSGLNDPRVLELLKTRGANAILSLETPIRTLNHQIKNALLALTSRSEAPPARVRWLRMTKTVPTKSVPTFAVGVKNLALAQDAQRALRLGLADITQAGVVCGQKSFETMVLEVRKKNDLLRVIELTEKRGCFHFRQENLGKNDRYRLAVEFRNGTVEKKFEVEWIGESVVSAPGGGCFAVGSFTGPSVRELQETLKLFDERQIELRDFFLTAKGA